MHICTLIAKFGLKVVHKEEGVKINMAQFFQIIIVIQKCFVERAFLLRPLFSCHIKDQM